MSDALDNVYHVCHFTRVGNERDVSLAGIRLPRMTAFPVVEARISIYFRLRVSESLSKMYSRILHL